MNMPTGVVDTLAVIGALSLAASVALFVVVAVGEARLNRRRRDAARERQQRERGEWS